MLIFFVSELRASAVNRSNVEGILFPEEIKTQNVEKLGSAQSLVPASFLVSRGAEGESLSQTHTLKWEIQLSIEFHLPWL